MPEKPGQGAPLLTCITCGVGFRDAELQRGHYKSDWHRYNLKRRVVDLASVTEDQFLERQTLQKQSEQPQSAGSNTRYCVVCKKSFSSQKAFDNHVSSRRHSIQLVKHNSQGRNTFMPLSLPNDICITFFIDSRVKRAI